VKIIHKLSDGFFEYYKHCPLSCVYNFTDNFLKHFGLVSSRGSYHNKKFLHPHYFPDLCQVISPFSDNDIQTYHTFHMSSQSHCTGCASFVPTDTVSAFSTIIIILCTDVQSSVASEIHFLLC